MKILSSKKWEEINQTVVDLKLDIRDMEDDCNNYLSQIAILQEVIKNKEVDFIEREEKYKEEILNLNNEVEIHSFQVNELKKKLSAMKRLCTQNGVDYSKLFDTKKK